MQESFHFLTLPETDLKSAKGSGFWEAFLELFGKTWNTYTETRSAGSLRDNVTYLQVDTTSVYKLISHDINITQLKWRTSITGWVGGWCVTCSDVAAPPLTLWTLTDWDQWPDGCFTQEVICCLIQAPCYSSVLFLPKHLSTGGMLGLIWTLNTYWVKECTMAGCCGQQCGNCLAPYVFVLPHESSSHGALLVSPGMETRSLSQSIPGLTKGVWNWFWAVVTVQLWCCNCTVFRRVLRLFL